LHGWLGIAELRNSTKARLAKLFIKDHDRAAEFKLNSLLKPGRSGRNQTGRNTEDIRVVIRIHWFDVVGIRLLIGQKMQVLAMVSGERTGWVG